MQSLWIKALLMLGAGCLLPLSLAPVYLWPLGIVAMMAPLLCCQQTKLKHNLLLAWCFGVGFNGVGVSWIYVSIHEYGSASVFLAGFLTSLFVAGLALFAIIPVYLWRRFFAGSVFAFVPLWVLQEWLRGWVLTGFPWLQLGDAHTETWLAGYAPILGSLGVSFVVLCVSYLAVTIYAKPHRRFIAVAAIAAIFVLGFALQQVQWSQAKGKPLRVALVQGNIPQLVKWSPAWAEKITQRYQRLSQPWWLQDLVVWPEMAITQFQHQSQSLLQQLQKKAAANNAALLTGLPTLQRKADDRVVMYNSAVVLGQGEGQYFKRQLVPFGDYVPLQQWLRGIIEFFNLPMSYAERGPQQQKPMRVGEHQLVLAICYEIAYASLVASSVDDPGFIATISNDTWFGGSIGPWQHLQLARMRAIENAKPVIRATNDGISALIDHNGRVLVSGPQFEEAVISGEIQARSGVTPFSRWYHLPLLLLCCGLLIGCRWRFSGLRLSPIK